MKTNYLLFFCLIQFVAFSQEKYKVLSGRVIDSSGVVKNATVVNLSTKHGTSTNDNGVFEIFVSRNDSLRISSIQHIPKKIGINQAIFNSKTITIELTQITYELTEFEIKRHNLSGILGIDSKNVPKNQRDSLLKSNMDFSKINMDAKIDDDYIDSKVRPPVVLSDPNSKFLGAGAAASIPFKGSQKLWALRKELNQKQNLPYKLLSQLGYKFFFEDLKIPPDNYFHFLEYCNPLGIEKLHKQGKMLEVIKILQTQSVSYLKIIKKE